MMRSSPYETLPFVIVLLGIALAFLAAAAPHHTAGYHLLTGLLVAGVLPYVLYAMAAAMRQDAVMLAGGVVILLVHGFLVFGNPVPKGDPPAAALYYGPLLLSLLALALLIRGMRTPWGLESK